MGRRINDNLGVKYMPLIPIEVICAPQNRRIIDGFLGHFCAWSGLLPFAPSENTAPPIVIAYGEAPVAIEPDIFIRDNHSQHSWPNDLDIGTSDGAIVFSDDIAYLSFVSLTYNLEQGQVSFGNHHDEHFPQGRGSDVCRAMVNIAFSAFKDALLQCLPDSGRLLFRSCQPEDASFSMALTHDIDYLTRHPVNRMKMLRNALKAVKNSEFGNIDYKEFSKFLFSRDPFDLSIIRSIERQFNLRSTFNFSGFQRRSGDGLLSTLANPSYSLKQVDRSALDGDVEIGMHGSTFAYDDRQRFNEELTEVQKLGQCHGGRQHMLSFKFPTTFELMRDSGYEYDSSMGFNDFNGFRGSCAIPHWPLEGIPSQDSIVEIPLLFMDSVYTKRGVFDPDRILSDATSLGHDAAKLSFTGAICWHDMSFYKGSPLAEAYKRILEAWKSMGGALLPARKLAAFHRQALGVRLECATEERCLVIVDTVPEGKISIFSRRSSESENLLTISTPGQYSINI